MDKLLVATNNKNKLIEIREILKDICKEIVSLSDVGIESDPEENGKTFEDNAIIKAKAAMEKSGLPTLADDSGICVPILNNAPGIYSARFAGENASDTENNQKLCKYLSKFDEKDRDVFYACSMALSMPRGGVLTANGECFGKFLLTPKGNNGFGYDPHFYLPEYDETMAELEPEIKNKISHRYHALCGIKEQMKLYNL